MRALTFTLAFVLALPTATAIGQVSGSVAGGGLGSGASPLVTAGELERHASRLAADELAGRRAGTAGAERAARYVVEAFQAAGLEAPSALPTYLQTFEFPIGVELGRDNRLVLQRGDHRIAVFEPGRDFVPIAGSLPDRVVQPVVFAGYGITAPNLDYDDYEGIDVRGKIVLVLRFGPEGDDPGGRFGRFLSERYKAANAREHGARAVLFVNGPATDQIDRLIPFGVDERPEATGIVAMSVAQSVGRRIVAIGDGDLREWQRQIDETGRPQSRLIPDAVVNLRVDLRKRTRTTHNVIGVVPGRDPAVADEAVVIGAHYDGLGIGGDGSLDPVPGEIHNGADDNASGVAAMLELAQFFAYPTNRPARTLVFIAFGAEEMGMLGSAHYVARPMVPLSDVVAMVNFDMVGRLQDELILYGVGSALGWTDIIERANERVGLPLALNSEGYGPSDHAAFYLRQIPVLAFFTGVHEDYHRATDDADRLNIEGLRRIAHLGQNIVSRLADGSTHLVFDPREFDPQRVTGEIPDSERGVRLGAVPAPVDADARVVIDRVAEGSAAQRAGLRKGDVVVRVGGDEVRTVYDYVAALESAPARRRLEIVIDREGEEMRLTVEPEGEE